MKVIIEKQLDKLGDEYMLQANTNVEMWVNDDNLMIEMEGQLYIFPKVLFTGLLNE